MKKILFEKPFRPFFTTGVVAAGIAIFLRYVHPGSILSVTVYNEDYAVENFRIWTWFSASIFFLATIYYAISKTKLKTQKWLIVSHYIFILLFLLFFVLFSSFNNPDVQKLTEGVPLSILISVYGTIFIADAAFLLLGILFFLLNIVSLKKDKLN